MKAFFAFALLLLTVVQPTTAQSIDSENSKVTFTVSNMKINTVEGTFRGMNGVLNFDAEDLANASFAVCIAAETVNTGGKKRDAHLRKDDFFYVEKYPEICFTSESITTTENGYLAQGTLTMRGVSEAVEIPFTYADNTFKGSFSIDRTAYKVGGKGGFMIGKTVNLEIVCVVK